MLRKLFKIKAIYILINYHVKFIIYYYEILFYIKFDWFHYMK